MRHVGESALGLVTVWSISREKYLDVNTFKPIIDILMSQSVVETRIDILIFFSTKTRTLPYAQRFKMRMQIVQ